MIPLMDTAFSRTHGHKGKLHCCSNDPYFAAVNGIVGGCDILLVVWNGLPSTSVGGTGAAVERAI